MINSYSTAILLSLMYCLPATSQEQTYKPNIVVFLGDDLNYCDIGCYGNPDVQTPTIDRLASDGLRFTRAYTATAMCGPSRMQLYTGIYPVRSGGFPSDLGQYDFDGTSFKEVLLGKQDTHNQYAYGVHTQANAIGAPETGYPVRSVRNDRYKYIANENSKVMFSNHLVVADPERFFFSWREAADRGHKKAKKLVDKYLFRPPEELYDLEKDPYEFNNLIASSRHADTLQELRVELKRWMAQQGDQGHETELDLMRKRNAAIDSRKQNKQ